MLCRVVGHAKATFHCVICHSCCIADSLSKKQKKMPRLADLFVFPAYAIYRYLGPMIRLARDIKSWMKPVVMAFCIVCLVVFIHDISASWHDVSTSIHFFFSKPWLVVTEVSLMVLNIGVESLRWRCVRRVFTSGSWADDVKASLRGVSLGNVTPGNVGEHVGRASSYVEHGKAGMASVVSSVLQTAVISLLGVFACLRVSAAGVGNADVEAVIGLSVLLAMPFLAIFCGRPLLRKVGAAGGSGRWLFAAAAINILKVLIFSFQFALLLCDGEWPSALVFSATLFYYFVITVIPRVNLIDVGVKGGVAAWVFGRGLCETSVINAAVVLIWVLNIVLPSIAGFISLVIRQKASR